MLEKQRTAAATQALGAAAGTLARVHEQIQGDRLVGLAALDRAVGALWLDYLKRLENLCDTGVLARGLRRLDTAARTDEDEYMDLPGYPEDQRQALLRNLHRLNLRVGTYERVLGFLQPVLAGAAQRVKRTPRLLDLASGYGGFPLTLAKSAREQGIALEATGSDIHPVHVSAGNERAGAEGLPVCFRVVNAFDMGDLREGEYDILTINQAIHHFTPGQLAKMIAESARVAGTGFVGFDYQRLLGALVWATTTYASPLRKLLPQPFGDFIHDAAISGRKMYHSAELTLIAKAAAPRAAVRCDTRQLGFNVLQVMRG